MQGVTAVAVTGRSLGVAGVQAEDFAEWVRPHLLAMTRLATRLAGPAAADDVVQESLVRAWRRRETYDSSRGTAAVWLLAITADRAGRHRARHRDSAELVDVAAEAPDVVSRVAVERAVRLLPRQQRLAVELHYFVGLPVAEAAAVMSLAEGTVKSHLSDARRNLRGLLGEDR